MAELTQEQLLAYVDQSIVALECETGKVVTIQEIQAYLEAQFGIKEASDIMYGVRLENEEESEE